LRCLWAAGVVHLRLHWYNSVKYSDAGSVLPQLDNRASCCKNKVSVQWGQLQLHYETKMAASAVVRCYGCRAYGFVDSHLSEQSADGVFLRILGNLDCPASTSHFQPTFRVSHSGQLQSDGGSPLNGRQAERNLLLR